MTETSGKDDPLAWTLTEAASAIRRGAVSSETLTGLCLRRIDRLQPALNAFISVEGVAAMAAARAADARLASGTMIGPLHGVPLAHKDMFYRAGAVSTCGSKIRRYQIQERTASVLNRLDAAGAIDLGRLNLSEFALGPTGQNAHFGRARNPWNPEIITGGSSSGSAAAVAAGMAFAALGTDTGGSIRLPAALCGVAGLKPSQGRVSVRDVMPLAPSMDCVGPMARSVGDLALMFSVLADTAGEAPRLRGRCRPDRKPRGPRAVGRTSGQGRDARLRHSVRARKRRLHVRSRQDPRCRLRRASAGLWPPVAITSCKGPRDHTRGLWTRPKGAT